MNGKKSGKQKVQVLDWPSHNRFRDLISYCVRGNTQPAFENTSCDDHVAELLMLMLDDTDDFFWFAQSPPEAVAIRKTLDRLAKKIDARDDLGAAETLYAVATYAAFEVLGLYLRKPDLFDQITPRRKLMPCLVSIHPNTAKVIAEMEKTSRLGQDTRDASLIKSRAWFTSDAPATVYARAILTCVELNQHLEPVEVQQKKWVSFDRQHRQHIRFLPFPEYLTGLDLLPVPITPESVLAYWRKGKEIILEEMPDFHLRREWESYRHRAYKHGAKPGAIQHAIFKDILVALRTIAGGNKGGRTVKNLKSNRASK